MVFLNNNFSWFHRSTHGFFLAKKYFKGKYKREIFLTVYDPKLDKSCYGYLFICEDNVILSILHDLTDSSGVYELDSSDILSIIEDDIGLGRIINSDKNGEKYAKVSTLNKICYVNLNDKYLLLINIQSDRIYYSTLLSGAYSVTYLTKKNYISKLKNLLVLIHAILNNKEPEYNLPTHGLNTFWSLLNIYIIITVLVVSFPIFIYLIFR